jgi:NAD(P)-dependent dehydrogenase (short-subunit alcohol dehydrogenase family)
MTAQETQMSQNPFSLQDKVAIVTGSSRGIGRSIAETMAGLGAKVVVSSRKPEPCEAVAKGIRDAGGEAIVIPCNISRRDEVDALVAGTVKQWGRVDVLVANAAVNPAYGPMAELTDEAFDKIINSNVKSTLWLCNLVMPGMAERGGGAVVIVSSIGGLKGSPVIGMYGVSKAADFALCRALAVEWGPRNVRINCIAPGLVKTDFARALWEDPKNLAKREADTPLRRIGQPHEIGPVAAFLASSASSFMTGQVVVVDGGVTIA